MTFASPHRLWALTVLLPLAFVMLRSYLHDARELPALVGEKRRGPLMAVFQVKSFFTGLFFLLSLAAGILALAEPLGEERLVEDDRSGLDLVFAVDVSRSMLAQDETPHRLGRARGIVLDTVEALPNGRFALVVFKGDAHSMVPLTEDRAALELALDAVGPSLLPAAGTNLEAGLALALGAFTDPGRYRVVLLLSDGEALGGDSVQAAGRAADSGVTILSVVLGDPAGTRLVLEDGRLVTDAQGDPVITAADDAMLEQVARTTGGRLYRADQADRIPRELLPILKGLEPGDLLEGVNAERESLVPSLLGASVLCLGISILVRAVRWGGRL